MCMCFPVFKLAHAPIHPRPPPPSAGRRGRGAPPLSPPGPGGPTARWLPAVAVGLSQCASHCHCWHCQSSANGRCQCVELRSSEPHSGPPPGSGNCHCQCSANSVTGTFKKLRRFASSADSGGHCHSASGSAPLATATLAVALPLLAVPLAQHRCGTRWSNPEGQL